MAKTVRFNKVTRNTRRLSLHHVFDIARHLCSSCLSYRKSKFSVSKLGRIISVIAGRRLEPTSVTSFAREVDEILVGIQACYPAIMNTIFEAIPTSGVAKLNSEDIHVSLFEPDKLRIENIVTSGRFRSDLESLKQFASANNIALVAPQTVPYRAPSIFMQLTDDITFSGTLSSKLEPDACDKSYVEAAEQPDSDKLLGVPESQEVVFNGTKGIVQEGIFFVNIPGPSSSEPISISEFIRLECIQYITGSISSTIVTRAQALSFLFPIVEVVPSLSDDTDVSALTLQYASKSGFTPDDETEDTNTCLLALNIIEQAVYPVQTSTPVTTRGQAYTDRVTTGSSYRGVNPQNIEGFQRSIDPAEIPFMGEDNVNPNSSTGTRTSSSNSTSGNSRTTSTDNRGMNRPAWTDNAGSVGRGQSRGNQGRGRGRRDVSSDALPELRKIYQILNRFETKYGFSL